MMTTLTYSKKVTCFVKLSSKFSSQRIVEDKFIRKLVTPEKLKKLTGMINCLKRKGGW